MNKVQNKTEHILNDAIYASSVRVVTDLSIGVESGSVVELSKLKQIAYQNGFDIVLLNGNTDPKLVRVCDYSKFLYEQKRKEKEAAKKQRESNKELKEVRLSSTISSGDLETKTRQIEGFLTDGHKVKLSILFKDRMIKKSDIGQLVMLKVADAVKLKGKADNMPALNGRNMIMTLSPIKK